MGRRSKKAKQPKQPKYLLVSEDTQEGQAIRALIDKAVEKVHKALVDAKIAPAWMVGKKPDRDGRLVLGKMKKASELERELHGFDAILLLNREHWRVLNEAQRKALVDHELCHLDVAMDNNLEVKEDAKGRKVYRIRKHDLEEFRGVIERHGCYLGDIQQFVAAALKKDPNLNLFEPAKQPAAKPTPIPGRATTAPAVA